MKGGLRDEGPEGGSFSHKRHKKHNGMGNCVENYSGRNRGEKACGNAA